MSRSGKAAIGTLVLAVLLIGGVYGLDRWALAQAEERVRTELSTAFPEAGQTEVEIGGALFLPQVLMGSLDAVHITSDSIAHQGLDFSDVRVEAHGVTIDEPRTVTDLSATATISPETVATLVQRSGRVPEGVTVEVTEGALRASATLFGVAVEATLAPVVESGGLRLEPETFTLGGLEVDAAAIPDGLLGDLAGIDVPLDALPGSLELESVEITGSDVRVRVAGTDIALDDLA